MANETCDICDKLIDQGTSLNKCLHKSLEDVKPLVPVKAEENDNNIVMPTLVGDDSSVKIELPSASKERGKTKKVDPVAQDTPQNTTPSAAINNQSTPIWFTLLAFNHHEDTNLQLPQIPSRYMRVKNRDLTVSYVQKYVAVKLGLESEDEVQLYLRDLPLDPSMWLRDLLHYWIATAYPQVVRTRVGASAADYMLVLSYGRKP